MAKREKMIRAFVAIDLPDEVKAALDEVGTALGEGLPRRAVRWVKPGLLHLTVRFLGDTAVSQLPAVAAALDDAAAAHPPLGLTLSELGCFPNRKRPRVIWAGVRGDVATAKALKAAVDEALLPLGWDVEDRPFRTHITLGRVKDNRAARDLNWETPLPELAFPVTAVHLIESQLTPDGPIYTICHTSPLGKEEGKRTKGEG